MTIDSIGSRLIVISGPSGAGKDTIMRQILAQDDRFSLSVSATTRKPRPGEQDGKDYYFMSEEEFSEKIKNDEFIEYTQYGNNFYGTLKTDVEGRILNGKIVCLVIEVCGGANIKRLYPDCLSVFIMPPSLEILSQRLRARCSEGEAEIQKRLEIAKTEIEQKNNYDVIIENDILDKTVKNVYSIILNKIGL